MSTAAPGFPAASSPSAASLAPGIQPFDPYALPAGTPSVPATTSWPAPGLTNPTSPYPAPPPGGAAPYGAAPTPYGGPAQPVSPPPYQRLFGNTGFRYSWISGNGEGSEMSITDLEFSTTANFANFFGNAGGLQVTPGFAFTWLSGPSDPVSSDMPGVLYSAYLDFGWNPVISPTLSAELNFRPGVFSDFQTVTKESVRLITSGIGLIRISPTSQLKLGVMYIDRADVKLLPAFGVLWTPNQQKRWDIFFPSPKIACYWKTVGNGQLWWYLGGEYGGGSWTMDRPEDPEAGASETVDINDIRVYVGMEWYNLNRMYSFLEFGYVFNRELFYVVVPSDRVTLKDAVMLRAGISF